MTNNNLRLDVCPCCNSESLIFLGGIQYSDNETTSYAGINIKLCQLAELWACEKCDSWFTQNRVTESDSIKLYSSADSWSSQCFEKSKPKEIVQLLQSLIVPNCKILDVGCANGALLDFARDRGASTYGLEYSETNKLLLDRKGHTAYANWAEVNGYFDIIAGFDLVEHLYNLNSFFDCCSQHLLKGGLLIIMTGDVSSLSAQKGRQSWWYVRYPEHIVFPSVKYFLSLSDFELVSVIKTYPYRLTISVLIRSFISSRIKPRPNSFTPSPLIKPDHMLVVLKKRGSRLST